MKVILSIGAEHVRHTEYLCRPCLYMKHVKTIRTFLLDNNNHIILNKNLESLLRNVFLACRRYAIFNKTKKIVCIMREIKSAHCFLLALITIVAILLAT